MKAMVLRKECNLKENSEPLEFVEMEKPVPSRKQILVKVSACGVCHTELDEIEGRTPPAKLPVIPGHQIIGVVEETGAGTTRFKVGDRVGVAWIYSTCGRCSHCLGGQENLCSEFQATGRDANGGYAEYAVVYEEFAYGIPDIFTDVQAAPLLCAGAIGYRSLNLCKIKDGAFLGLTGFGASAHLVLKMVKHKFKHTKIYVFARNVKEREFALNLGAVWAGDTDESSPEKLHAIIDTTPVWKPLVAGLKNLRPGGRFVINAIRKENLDKEILLDLDYPAHLWLEKEIKSVANVERRDVREFLGLAARIPIIPDVQEYSLEKANQALMELKTGKIRGAKVLVL